MARLSSIPFYDDEQKIFYILKFKNAKDLKHLESLQNGEIYMNPLGLYNQIEKEEGKKGVGDRYDGHLVFSNLSLTITNVENGEKTETQAENLSLSFNNILKMPTFCSYAVTPSLLEIIHEDEDQYIVELVFEPQELERIINDFGDYVLIIRYAQFIEQLDKASVEKQFKMRGKKIKYANYGVEQLEYLKADHLNIAFWKSDEFAHQNEHRFLVTSPPNTETPLVIQIGDLKGHSHILPSRDLIENPFRFSIAKSPKSSIT